MAPHSDEMSTPTDSLPIPNWNVDDLDTTPLKSLSELSIPRPTSPSRNTEYESTKLLHPNRHPTPPVLEMASTSSGVHQEELTMYCDQCLLFLARLTNPEGTLSRLQDHQYPPQPPPPPTNGGIVEHVYRMLKDAGDCTRWRINSFLDAAAKKQLDAFREAADPPAEGIAGHAQEHQTYAEVLALQNAADGEERVLEELEEMGEKLSKLCGNKLQGMSVEEEADEWRRLMSGGG